MNKKPTKPVVLKTCINSGTGGVFKIELPITIKADLRVENETKPS